MKTKNIILFGNDKSIDNINKLKLHLSRGKYMLAGVNRIWEKIDVDLLYFNKE